MAHMVYSTLLTSTVRSERQECPPCLTSRHIDKCATHSVRAWPRVLWWRKRMGGRRAVWTHCEAPHWCVHPQVTEGWRGQPVRLEIGKGGRFLKGPAGTVGEEKRLWGQRWRDCMTSERFGVESGISFPNAARQRQSPIILCDPLACTQKNWQTPHKPMEDWVVKILEWVLNEMQ